MSTTQHTPTTTAPTNVHVDRSGPFDFDGLQWADTNCEPIAEWNRDSWDLFVFGEDLPIMLGGHSDMTDQEVQDLAREALNDAA
ncbi:hypothetical protein [Kocuria turfanensis]|uniref:Uncharacterized protein n=1 Tax=Kocuria turfanensis TaxID=388357 RepID=A0A512IBZ4_9MICC|nr:hypothetical protein [Kocuria turfanensis]GEO95211.1 hypothetical protein KTU01_13340 [Kocuria turfanensis]